MTARCAAATLGCGAVLLTCAGSAQADTMVLANDPDPVEERGFRITASGVGSPDARV